ncbi:MAG: FAD-dependent oxidoreductase [Segetibacter sp.]
MYITPSDPLRSILPITIGGQSWLLVGGEGHIPGLGGGSEARYQKLADYAKDRFGVTPTYRWLARDYLSYDDIPLIGKIYPWSKNVYVATGFMKWGLTNGTVAGMILSDRILGKNNPWAATFDSNRLGPIKSIPKVFAKYTGLSSD